MSLELKNLYDNFRDADTIKAYAKIIAEDAKKLQNPINYGGVRRSYPYYYEIRYPSTTARKYKVYPRSGLSGLHHAKRADRPCIYTLNARGCDTCNFG